ncbi:efflux RND transporter periplasmic adaptor subunit [Variovorax sp. J22G73]|uniref:efflux RND transporter periplasmic adaptor subunit n=1 Tax=unclassified Variovorax TaxID=663243 RepID=UPI002574D326|nr:MULTISPECIES: efflux RND transporter periplasmic adaptor subunit [unclassified Variovorax]MDM0005226.1 efflux RND transporter periplasmic adaptor subunit [Variovorax sp. J22R203]MDM0098642.1 efflux RND transporter periplasmic adaptor subunit [Variovorax sp. J22G73]
MQTPSTDFQPADTPPPRASRKLLLFALAGTALALLASAAVLGFGGPRKKTTVPAAAIAALTVQSATAREVPWPATLDASGAIAPWQETVVGTQVAGLRLVELRVNVGDTVRRGQLLARFDADTLRADCDQLQAALDQAVAQAAQATTNRDRALKLQGSGGISEQEVLQHVTQADSARAQVGAARAQLASRRLQLRHAEVLAPDDGVISARSATLGAVGTVGQELFRLIRQGRLEWRGELTATQFSQAERGQQVVLALPDGRSVEARVRQLAPTLDAQTRLGLVYADLAAGGPARAGMYAGGSILLAQRPALVVPAASLLLRDGRTHVLKLTGTQRMQRVVLQTVVAGRRRADEAEIVQGLAAGERVVARGAGFLNDGDTVRLADSHEGQTP